MFKKKSCKNCGNKISNKYDFCPYCGNRFNGGENWGMLGKNDSQDDFGNFTNSFFGSVGGKMFGKIFEGTMKMLEKEMQKETRDKSSAPRTNMQLFINGKRINLGRNPQIQKVRKSKEQIKEMPLNNLSQESMKKISTLPKQEPLTNIRRLADKVIYEIDMPEVSSIKNVSIVKLENSIEIKAIAKNKVYVKLIPINLPIINYGLSEGKLILELGVKD